MTTLLHLAVKPAPSQNSGYRYSDSQSIVGHWPLGHWWAKKRLCLDLCSVRQKAQAPQAVLRQQVRDSSSQWHPVAVFLCRCPVCLSGRNLVLRLVVFDVNCEVSELKDVLLRHLEGSIAQGSVTHSGVLLLPLPHPPTEALHLQMCTSRLQSAVAHPVPDTSPPPPPPPQADHHTHAKPKSTSSCTVHCLG